MHKSFELGIKLFVFTKFNTFQVANSKCMKAYFNLLLFPVVLFFCSCKNVEPITEKSGYQGQGPTAVVSTTTRPVQKQWKGTWALKDSTVFFSNQFDGARLNGVVHDEKNHYTLWFTAENTPVNPSPWYGFKIWSTISQEVILRLTYQDSRNRYYPKISRDGQYFKVLDSSRFKPINPGEGQFGLKAAPEFVEITIPIDEQPTWITAQELYTSRRVTKWVDSLSQQSFVTNYPIGKSREKRPINLMEVNGGDSKKALMIISFQHPPEVTGFLAMKSFMETLAGESEQAKVFRREFTIFSVPLMNPDGVDNGHWRHNFGGIDLNRDWAEFNQPETQSVRDFLQQKAKEGYTFVFGADFHSTWDDIYYPLDTTVTGSKGQIVFDWIESIEDRLPQKKANVSASKKLYPTMTSRNHFFAAYQMPSIVFELGDNTPRPFLKEKGRVAAEELMQLLME